MQIVYKFRAGKSFALMQGLYRSRGDDHDEKRRKREADRERERANEENTRRTVIINIAEFVNDGDLTGSAGAFRVHNYRNNNCLRCDRHEDVLRPRQTTSKSFLTPHSFSSNHARI